MVGIPSYVISAVALLLLVIAFSWFRRGGNLAVSVGLTVLGLGGLPAWLGVGSTALLIAQITGFVVLLLIGYAAWQGGRAANRARELLADLLEERRHTQSSSTD